MLKENFDVIIVGTGAAGLYTALNLPENMQVLMITKDEITKSNSYLAQGGIAVLKGRDDYHRYLEDTLKAGHYENNRQSVDVMIRESQWVIQDLIGKEVVFDRNDEGCYDYTREGAHSIDRILHHKDQTGKEIVEKLIGQVRKKKNILIYEYVSMIDLLVEEGRCRGIIAEMTDGLQKTLYGQAVVLACGGIGGLFESTTNHKHIAGDGLAIAIKHQIQIENIHYIQIHPTTLYREENGQRFLISEAVRGEGACLYNHEGQRFVNELLPRDKVTAAIAEEMEKSGRPYVHLSVLHMGREAIIERFPHIYNRCLEEGIDMTREMIPVSPAQHYHMGGIKANTRGQTSCDGLYVVGEAACNGVHGKNRLASNSLLESLVFARRAAQLIGMTIGQKQWKPSGNTIKYLFDENREETYKKIILNEIKRKDRKFYDKWCVNEYTYR